MARREETMQPESAGISVERVLPFAGTRRSWLEPSIFL
jgi:hypothetical protein